MIDALMTMFAALAALIAAPPPAVAESAYCIPKAGIDRFPKTASVCPVGFFSTGRCCEALHRDTPRAFPKLTTACPVGTFASAGYCVSSR